MVDERNLPWVEGASEMPPLTIRTVAITGAGIMGSQIGQVLAASRFEVRLHDISPELLGTAIDRIKSGPFGLSAGVESAYRGWMPRYSPTWTVPLPPCLELTSTSFKVIPASAEASIAAIATIDLLHSPDDRRRHPAVHTVGEGSIARGRPMSGESNVMFWLEQYVIEPTRARIDRIMTAAKASDRPLTED